jgi:signal transduction histidine kinase
LLLLLVHAVGAEADKLSLLRRAEQDLRELNLLYRVGQVLASNLELDTLLDAIQRHTPEVLGAERCSIMLHDPQRRELVFEAIHSNGEIATMRVPDDRGIAGWVFSHGEGQIVNNVADDERFYNAVQRQTAFVTRSIVCAPMCTREQTVGVIQVLNKVNGEPFNQQDLRLLTTLASQAAIAIENAHLYASLAEERDRLLTKEAEVRHLIARELHDGPTQSVAAIAMNIEFTKRLLQLMPEQVPAELDNVLELAKKTSHDIRTLLFELRPLVLETKGLLGAVEQYVTRFRDPAGIRLRLDAPHELPPITREAEAATFMIIQEAVNNARKYAGPVEVVISFRYADERMVATVRDAGRGFDLAAVQRDYNSRGSLGLLNMHERARLIGAEFAMRSSPGAGTEVELRVPLIQERAARV